RTPYGNQLVGCEAAARMYFGKPARDLSLAESAYLAVLPRAPSVFNPYRSRTRVVSRQRALIDALSRAGAIGADERERALSEELVILERRSTFAAPHFVDMLQPRRAGGVLVTTLDAALQAEAERLVAAHLAMLAEHNVTNAAAVIVENATGEILALVGSGDFFDERTGGQVNGATARRQPGSTLKPFVYAVALESGFTAASVLPDVPLAFPTPGGEYAPQNYDRRFRGPVRARAALANSLNVPAVQLLSDLGVPRVLGALREMGFASLDASAEHYGLGLTLGGGEVTLLELAGAYAMLARGGVALPLSLIKRESAPKGRRVIAAATAFIVADILADDGARRQSFGEDSPLDLGFRVAAKTGTSKNFRDNWTVGFTRDFTVAVWAGNFDADPMRGVSGITGAGPLFRDLMTMLAHEKRPAWIERPDGIVTRAVCPLSGTAPGPHCPTAIEELFAGEPAD
ncbi:MAG: penicillin-binding transpeptidase domain-containing protein, partial [Planctomycetota bacterium]